MDNVLVGQGAGFNPRTNPTHPAKGRLAIRIAVSSISKIIFVVR